MFDDAQINMICDEYDIDCNTIGNLIDTSKNEEDRRFNYEINSKYFLKITNSKAISEKILVNIANMVSNYCAIGIYCPSLIRNKIGNYSYLFYDKEVQYICYIEEKSPYKNFDDSIGIDYEFKKQVLEHLGILASKFSEYKLADRRSMWSIIELGAYDNKIDEKQENFDDLVNALKSNGLKTLANKLIKMNKVTRVRIKSIMDRLPKCVYQGDLNNSNILIDENKNFVGLIDYNMFGTEVNINCFLNESMYYITKQDFDMLSAHEIFEKIRKIQGELLSVIWKNYCISQNEREVLEDYNKIIYSSFYPNAVLMIRLLKKQKYINKIAEFLNIICSQDFVTYG